MKHVIWLMDCEVEQHGGAGSHDTSCNAKFMDQEVAHDELTMRCSEDESGCMTVIWNQGYIHTFISSHQWIHCFQTTSGSGTYRSIHENINMPEISVSLCWNDADLAWDSPVINTSLPELARVPLDVAHNSLLVGKVHLPCEGPIAKDPHLPEWQ